MENFDKIESITEAPVQEAETTEDADDVVAETEENSEADEDEDSENDVENDDADDETVSSLSTEDIVVAEESILDDENFEERNLTFFPHSFFFSFFSAIQTTMNL